MTFKASIGLTVERPARNRQSHGSSCRRRVPVTHLAGCVARLHRLTEPVDVAATKTPFFKGAGPV